MKGAPVTIADFDEEWIAARHAIIRREGYATRPGEGNTIEVQSINTGLWHVLTLRNDATQFASAEDRDVILRQLQTGVRS